MINGATATIFVAEMSTAVRFYTETLGLAVEYRAGDEWASLRAADGASIGLHPQTERSPAGRNGSITVGFPVDEPLEDVIGRLEEAGVRFRGPIRDDGGIRLAYFDDPDGHELYLVETSRPGSPDGASA